MEQIISGYHEFFFVRLAIWTVLGSLVWVLLSVPFYIIRRFFFYPYKLGIEYLVRQRLSLIGHLQKAMQKGESCYSKFVHNHQYRYVLDDYEKVVKKALYDVKEIVSGLKTHFLAAHSGIVQTYEKFLLAISNLPQTEQTCIVTEKPTQLELTPEQATDSYTAKLSLCFSAGFLIALIIYNTIMLNLFFSDLIGIYLIYALQIKVSHFLAFIFSIGEVVLGFLFWMAGQTRSKDGIGSNLVQGGVILFILLLSFFEAVVYSRISLEIFSQLSERLIGDDMPRVVQMYFLAPLGFVVVFMLSILGHLFFKSLHQYRSIRYIKRLIDEQKRFNERNIELSKTIDQLRDSYEGFKESLNEYKNQIVFDESPQVNQRIDAINQILASVIAEKQKTTIQPVPDSEKANIYYLHIAYLVGILVSLVFVTAIASSALTSIGIVKPWLVGFFCSCLIIIMFLLSGYVMGKAAKVVEGEDGQVVAVNQHGRMNRSLCVLMIGLIALGCIYFAATSVFGWKILAFSILMAIFVFLALMGPRLASITHLSHLMLSRILTFAWVIAIILAFVAVYIFTFILHLVKFGLDLLAQPVLLVRREELYEQKFV